MSTRHSKKMRIVSDAREFLAGAKDLSHPDGPIVSEPFQCSVFIQCRRCGRIIATVAPGWSVVDDGRGDLYGRTEYHLDDLYLLASAMAHEEEDYNDDTRLTGKKTITVRCVNPTHSADVSTARLRALMAQARRSLKHVTIRV